MEPQADLLAYSVKRRMLLDNSFVLSRVVPYINADYKYSFQVKHFLLAPESSEKVIRAKRMLANAILGAARVDGDMKYLVELVREHLEDEEASALKLPSVGNRNGGVRPSDASAIAEEMIDSIQIYRSHYFID